jgi:hypothetical protein
MPVFVWTLPFSAKMPQNVKAKKFLRRYAPPDRLQIWHGDGPVGEVQ